MQQNNLLKQSHHAYNIAFHNFKEVDQARAPEEGIESMEFPDNVYDPLKPNIKKLEREIRNELKVLQLERPNIAARHLEFLTSKNTGYDYEFS